MATLKKMIEQARTILAKHQQTEKEVPLIFIYQPGDLANLSFEDGGPREPVQIFIPDNGR